MNLKKILAAAFVAGAMTVGAFAENHPYGMDIAFGIVDFEAIEYKYNGAETKYNVINFFPIKINTYDCFWLNNHLGIYASIGLHPGIKLNEETKIGGAKTTNDKGYLNCGFEFMTGPAFGVDFGDSSVRFQVGAPLHFMGGVYYRDEKNSDTKYTLEYGAFGFALTPQFRFMANRRCSLVVGADFVFDFVMNFTEKVETNNAVTTRAFHPSDELRFAWTPYIGLGINFGK